MIQQDFLIVANSASKDEENLHYLGGIFDVIYTAAFPFLTQKMVIVSRFSKKGILPFERTRYPHLIVITDPNGKKIASLPSEISFNNTEEINGVGYCQAQFTGTFRDLKLEIPGLYEVSVYLDGNRQPLTTYFLVKYEK